MVVLNIPVQQVALELEHVVLLIAQHVVLPLIVFKALGDLGLHVLQHVEEGLNLEQGQSQLNLQIVEPRVELLQRQFLVTHKLVQHLVLYLLGDHGELALLPVEEEHKLKVEQ